MPISSLGRIALAIGRARAGGGDLHDQAEAALSAIQKWQPIETAPKDGTEIWMVQADGYQQVGEWAVWRQTPCWVIVDSQVGGVIEAEPTHWMPLPKPPQAI